MHENTSSHVPAVRKELHSDFLHINILSLHGHAHVWVFYFLSIMKTSETQIIPSKCFALHPFWLLVTAHIQEDDIPLQPKILTAQS